MGRWDNTRCDVSELEGKTLVSVKRDENADGNDALVFLTADNVVYQMSHYQDCCEGVNLSEIHGDFEDLIGSPILHASEHSNGNETEWGHETWTFYVLRTIKGTVTLRWHGSSNGYYGEGVDFERVAG
jgi:hypothetical protein